MNTPKRLLRAIIALLAIIASSAVLALLHYLQKTPQPLNNDLPGEAHIYKWTYAHIFYKASGALDAPPLLLLHAPEIGASSHEMRGIIEDLAQHYRVYVPDLPGFGLSDHPQTKMAYSANTYVAFCHDFLQDVIGQPTTVFASGLSCTYAAVVAATHPQLCRSLILISPESLFVNTKRSSWLIWLMEKAVPGLILYSFLTLPFVLPYIVAHQRKLAYNQIAPADLDYIFAAAHQLGAQHASLASLAGRLDLPSQGALTGADYLAKVQCPVLIIWGIHAFHAVQSIASVSGPLRATQEIVISDAHARVHEEYPARVVADVQKWQGTEVAEKAESSSEQDLSSQEATTDNLPASVSTEPLVEPIAQELARTEDVPESTASPDIPAPAVSN
ncbi:MAG TPA: alpha/beta hydrolase, partial [Ktedonobacteraceae bacterium]|nr:alpha/beta hydrolase [Ktedonobacteraceae bacterium]